MYDQAIPVISFPKIQRGAPFWIREPRIVGPSVPQFTTKFSEFYCDPVNGSNLNGGSDPNASPVYSAVNGNWDGTNNYTPTDGSNPAASGVMVDMMASVFVDGATTGVFIGRVTAVGAGVNGVISIATGTGNTNKWTGTRPTVSATTRSIRVGGAWKGPSGSDLFPFSLVGGNGFAAMPDMRSDGVRINYRNNATYTFTGITPSSLFNSVTHQGYSATPSDGGKVVFATSVSGTIVNDTAQWVCWTDFIFDGAAQTSGSVFAFLTSGSKQRFFRCVFKNAWTSGWDHQPAQTGGQTTLVECEAYNCNRCNTAGQAGFFVQSGNTGVVFIRCYSHDHTTANGNGFLDAAEMVHHFGCIAANCQGYGFIRTTGLSLTAGTQIYMGCDAYNNRLDGLNGVTSDNNLSTYWIENCNFVKNGGYGINMGVATTIFTQGFVYNCGFGSGNYGNVAGRINPGSLIETAPVIYPPNLSPYNSPDTGDFSLVLSAGIASGRGSFTEVDGTHLGTVGYPDIGAAPHSPNVLPPGWGDHVIMLPDAYVNHAYVVDWAFSRNVALSLVSGSLPPGIGLSTLSGTHVQLTGTPTSGAGQYYTSTIRATVGNNYADGVFTFYLRPDPATTGGSTGGVSGG